jgi:trimeric autotransporter adhesin
MKKKFFSILLSVLLAFLVSGNVWSQANTALSNLVSTSINQSLLPNGNNTLSLGSTTRSWRFLYLDSQVYIKDVLAIHSRGTGNFFTGQGAGNLTFTGTYNSAFGQSALPVLSSGSSNTAIGFSAMYSNNTGTNNTAIGTKAMNFNTSGRSNVAAGYRALYSNTTGFSNVGVGYGALYSNTYGGNNVAVGDSALFFNNQNTQTVAVGSKALYSNTTGFNNNAVGFQALYSNTTGGYNSALGFYSMYSNINGYVNTANGYLSLYRNTSGSYNAASGGYALYNNTTANFNTATGYFSLFNNSTGTYNTANGSYALSNNTGSYNTAVGYSALTTNTSGIYLTAVGYNALYSCNGGGQNTGIGDFSLYGMTNPSGNVALGHSALYNTSTAPSNTGIGNFTLLNVTTQGYNSALGYFAGVASSAITNSTAIGYNANATASNQVMLGNTSVTSVRAAGGFVIYSDGRFKKDLKENVPGLDFIKELRPVTYHYDVHGINTKIGVDEIKAKAKALGKDKGGLEEDAANANIEEAAITAKEKKLYTGFVAQEVEKAAKKLNFDFSGVYTPENDKDLYGLSYSDFVVPLVKAAQELSAQNDELKQEVASLQQQNAAIISRVEKMEALLKISSGTALIGQGSLEQNTPNPVRTNTTIAYTLPATYSYASINITDASGKFIKSINVSGSGRNTLNLDAAKLAAGTYQYTLYVDKRSADSKQFVIAR